MSYIYVHMYIWFYSDETIDKVLGFILISDDKIMIWISEYIFPCRNATKTFEKS